MMLELGVTWWEIVKSCRSILTEVQQSRIADRRDFFQDHIAPSFSLLERIHGDYLTKFGQLARMLVLERSQSFKDIAHWLQQQQAGLAAQRHQVHELVTELDESAFFEAVASHRSKTDSDIHVHSLRYVKDVGQYFCSADPWSSMTWYTDFIRSIEDIACLESPIILSDSTFAISGCVGEIRGAIELAVRQTLPDRFKNVSNDQAALRGLCLK